MVTKRTIKKIRPGKVDVFDDQFWPVLVALCVLAAIGVGAIITLLRGPWMWLSLLLLPAITALSLMLLSRMRNKTLRRTLQFSLIVSLASHLLILIVASLLLIFSSGEKKNWNRVAKRMTRTIQFSNSKNTVSIPVSKPDPTPEPEVEIKRETTSVTSKEQPIAVTPTKPTVSPQTRRREKTQSSIPRFSESLARLRRSKADREVSKNLGNPAPKPVSRSDSAKRSSPTPKSESATEREPLTASTAADSIQRSSSISASRDVVRDANPSPVVKPIEITKRREARRNEISPSPTKANRPERLQRTRAPSAATARIRRPKSEARSKTAKAAPRASRNRPIESAAAMQPAESSGQLTRRPRRNEKTTVADQPSKVSLKKSSQPKQVAVARRDSPTPPAVTNPLSSTRSNRLASNDAPTMRSIEPANRPAPNPKSDATSESLQPRTLSITKGQTGTAGAVAKQNMQSGEGGLPSPAVRPSDAVINRKTQSPDSTARMLTNAQAARVRRSTAESRQPKSAFRATTQNVAKISGSTKPATESVESSAANIDSASSRSRQKVAIEEGSATVNLGPTKVVAEAQRRQLSGGGSPEVASLNPSRTRRSTNESTARPSLANADNAPTAAPRETAAQPRESASEEPTDLANLDRRGQGSDSTIADLDATSNVDPSANEGTAADPQLAAMRQKESQSDSRSQNQRLLDSNNPDRGDDEDDDEEERLRKLIGDSSVRIATAPSTSRQRDPSAGSTGNAQPTDPSESSAADNTSRSSASRAISIADAIGQSATRMAIQSAASLPVVDGSLARRTTPANSKNSVRKLAASANTSKRSTVETAPEISSNAATVTKTEVDEGTGDTEMEESADASNVEIARGEPSSGGKIKFDVSAIEGPTGVGNEPDVDAGINMRPASVESTQLQPELDTRFRNRDFGGAPAVNPTATIAKEAFRQRTPGMAEASSEPKTEAAINRGLEFLARFQQPDGSWSLTRFDTEHRFHQYQLDSDTAATGLAVLAFQGAGYNHREFKYARQINHAIEWLIENQGDDGVLYLDADEKSDSACRLYSHGIAALALTEAYGMTQDPMLKEPAQKALDFIAQTQHPTMGGWRYFTRIEKRQSDTSVTGWMVMALQSGRLAGLDVKDETFAGIDKWLKVAADPVNESLYRYNPYAVNTPGVSRIQRRNATPSMTAVGLLMRIYTGWQRDDPRLLSGARFMVQQQLPGETRRLRDTYYWYYATQVLKHIGGPEWETWNNALRPLLIRTQEKTGDYAGSWDPYSPVPDRWAPHGGRLYLTTMNLLSLEVRHRLLPLYQKTNDAEESDD